MQAGTVLARRGAWQGARATEGGRTVERMSTLDAGFFFVEHENVPMHLGSLAVFEGPAPAHADLVQMFAAKLPLVPRYRQVVRTTPLQVFRPMWVDDEHFEVGYHVRHAAVPAPGGAAELRSPLAPCSPRPWSSGLSSATTGKPLSSSPARSASSGSCSGSSSINPPDITPPFPKRNAT